MQVRSTFSTTVQLASGLIAIAVFVILLLVSRGTALADTAGWLGYGSSPQHTAVSSVPTQSLESIKWQTPVDLHPQYSGRELLIHYGSPLVSAAGTVIVTVKTGISGGFEVTGVDPASGNTLWTKVTDYSLPPHGWTPECGSTLDRQGVLYTPAAAGTVLRISGVDTAAPMSHRLAFYGIGNFNRNRSVLKPTIKIDTPITRDGSGNIYFGFLALGNNPLGLKSGLARIAVDGKGSWVGVAAASGDSRITEVVMNSAPAFSNDGKTVYVAVSDGSNGYLLGLDSTTLATKYKVGLTDPISGEASLMDDDGTASPMVGPDGDVYYGVLEEPLFENHFRGFMLHFNSALTLPKTPGAFGWDDTPSVVPSEAVPSYTGSSKYLLLTKYNNYLEGGGDGDNKVAVLDPKATEVDPISGATTMKEVITVSGVTPDGPPPAVKEWCINSAAVDPATKSALINSEDGNLYRWDFTSNTLSEQVRLTGGLGEAYTPTLVGNDGTVFAVSNAKLFAVGE